MPSRFSILILAIASLLCAEASGLPEASEKRAVNLQHYLAYRTKGHLAFTCEAKSNTYRCTSRDQKLVEVAEDNSTTEIRFKALTLHFGGAVSLHLDKASFQKTLREIRQSETERRKRLASNAGALPIVSPRKKALERALLANLEHLRLDALSVRTTAPRTTLQIGMLELDNRMKRSAKGVAFSERVLGKLCLGYRDAVVETNGSKSLNRMLPAHLERWLETNNTTRADYVAQRLEQLNSGELSVPKNGRIVLQTRYIGNDAIALSITAHEHNRAGESAASEFHGELHGASTLFPPARKPAAPGQLDFLLRSLHSVGTADAKRYRALLKNDKRFNGYIREYDALIRARLDRLAAPFRRNAEVAGWFTQVKSALSKLLNGKADTLEMTLVNKSGLTLLQLFNLLLSRMAVLPQQDTAMSPDPKRMLTDTVAEHFDLRILTR